MSTPQVGAAVAATLALSAMAFGFWAMLLVALFMVVGALAGGAVGGQGAGGRIDVRGVVDALLGKRSSS